MVDDAELVVVSFGITSRSAKKAVRDARKKGLKIGLFRPKTAWPFPYWRLQDLADEGADILVVEINMGQMVRVVREHIRSSKVYGMAIGPGACPSPEEIFEEIKEVYLR